MIAAGAAADTLDLATFARELARAGYVAIPFRWDYRAGGHQLFNAKIDTITVSLLLDSGMGGKDLTLAPRFADVASVQRTDVKSQSGYTFGTRVRDGVQAIVGRMAVGPATLEALEATVEEPVLKGIDAIFAAPALNSYAAVVDFATDTLYLLAVPRSRVEAPASPPERADNLRAALEAAGHYRTFLALARRAGLAPLLEGTEDRKSVV